MARKVFTTTISLPKSMAKTLEKMRKWENRSTSELMREALRHYSRFYLPRSAAGAKIPWKKLRADLKKISRSGKQNVNLAEFIVRDRERH